MSNHQYGTVTLSITVTPANVRGILASLSGDQSHRVNLIKDTVLPKVSKHSCQMTDADAQPCWWRHRSIIENLPLSGVCIRNKTVQ